MPKPAAAPSTTPPVEVRASGLHGLGAFATRPLRKGEPIGVYQGRRYGPGEAADKDWNHALTYVFGLADGSLIDAAEGGNHTRHLNHSCEPNCVAYEVEDADGRAQIEIETRRRIKAGEELTLDYALDVGDENPAGYACRCGSARCRQTMVAVAAAPPA